MLLQNTIYLSNFFSQPSVHEYLERSIDNMDYFEFIEYFITNVVHIVSVLFTSPVFAVLLELLIDSFKEDE